MRIAQICPYDVSRSGGVQSHVLGLTGELRRRGHTVLLVSPSWWRSVPFNKTQIDVAAVDGKTLAGLTQARLDLVHYHTFWNPIVPWQVRAVLRARSVATFHDVARHPILRNLAMPLGARLVARLVNETIAVSPATQRYLPGSAHLIPNGVHLSEFRSEGEDGLLYVGRLEPRKAVHVLLEAFGRLDFPGLTLTIAGDGPLRSSLERIAPPNTRFLGVVDDETRRSLLANCTLLCAPATHGESFGIVLAEAMASGKPPVAAANEGYRSVLTGPLEELLVPPGDPEALAGRLSELLRDPERRRALGRKAYEHAQQYDWVRVVDQVEKVYARALA